MARRESYLSSYERPAPPSNRAAASFLAGLIGLVAGGAGFILPNVIGSDAIQGLSWESLTAGHAPKKKARPKVSAKQSVFIPFGEVIVNLAEERLTRHLQVRITLVAGGADQERIEGALESHRAVLMNWLISYLSDKSLDEVRGAAGVNRARRDIQDRFNGLLFADGSEKVRDVLFEEFTVR